MNVDPRAFELGDVGGSGPAALCLHGLTGTPWEVRSTAEALAQRGFACAGPLLPGHGSSPEELGRTSHARWLESALAEYDRLARTHARVYVLGLSMGGVLTLALGARRQPSGIAVLAAPFDLGRAVHWGVPLLRRFVRFLPKTPAIADAEARARHPGYDRMPLAAVAELIELAARVRGELASVRAPLLCVYSRRDPTVAPRNAELVLREVGSEQRDVHWLERSHHVLPVDCERAEVAERVSGFFSRLDASALTG
jgi:carboxylesterase